MQTPEQIYKRIHDDAVLDICVADEVLNPGLVAAELGLAFQYSCAVESEVPESADVIRTVLPNMSDDLSTFFDVWEEQEVAHGAAQRRLLKIIGLDPRACVNKTSVVHKAAGKIASISPGFHDITEYTVLVYAALGERETQMAYGRISHKLTELGEVGLAQKLVVPTNHQEGLHLAYYRAAILERHQRLSSWQLRAASTFIELTYMPVGVQRNNRDRKRQFGEMMLTIVEADPVEPAIQTQKLAATLLVGAEPRTPFLERRYKQCLDELTRST